MVEVIIYILLRFWKFALHHKGPQVRYLGKFMSRQLSFKFISGEFSYKSSSVLGFSEGS